jgi:alanyl-tRNA synthetase
MQFDRSAVVEGGKTVGYKLTPLPQPSIDTGMGLERVTSVLEGVSWIYETDLFTPLIKRAAELTGFRAEPLEIVFAPQPDAPITVPSRSPGVETQRLNRQLADNPSLRIIADHSRAATFLISDGVLPSNEGRGYVLRKIIRRAIRHGRLLGQDKPFLYQMVFAVCDLMKDAYPELAVSAEHVSDTIKGEETRFAHTLDIGLKRLEDDLVPLAAERKSLRDNFDEHFDFFKLSPQVKLPTYSGEKAFKLYDTFGLPRDFIEDAVRDAGITFDSAGFDAAMEEQKARARASWKGGGKATASSVYSALPKTIFEGYGQTRFDNCEVLAMIKRENGAAVGAQELKPGERGEIVLDHTPFYAESGGQVGDVGWLYAEDHNTLVAEVEGVTYPVQGVRAHRVVAKQQIHVGDQLDAVVNEQVRLATMRNHTGTHLVHAALREVLGSHVKQAGSLVDPAHLRFDFSHFAALGDEELQDIEDLANREVLKNDRVAVIEDVPIEVAINEYKAMALFGEKYGDRFQRRAPPRSCHWRRLATPLPQRPRVRERRRKLTRWRRRPVARRSVETRTRAPRGRIKEAPQRARSGTHEVGFVVRRIGG